MNYRYIMITECESTLHVDTYPHTHKYSINITFHKVNGFITLQVPWDVFCISKNAVCVSRFFFPAYHQPTWWRLDLWTQLSSFSRSSLLAVAPTGGISPPPGPVAKKWSYRTWIFLIDFDSWDSKKSNRWGCFQTAFLTLENVNFPQ